MTTPPVSGQQRTTSSVANRLAPGIISSVQAVQRRMNALAESADLAELAENVAAVRGALEDIEARLARLG